MSDVARLEAELALAKLSETLEEAREAMHADRNPDTIADYQEASNAVADARKRFRENYRTEVGPGDAAPTVDTIGVTAGAHTGVQE